MVVFLIRLLYLLLLITTPIAAFCFVFFTLGQIARLWERYKRQLIVRYPMLATLLFGLITCYALIGFLGIPFLAARGVFQVLSTVLEQLPQWAADMWISQCG